MRPVNLIPAENRRGGVASSRSVVAYAIVGALVLALGVLSALALFDGKIADRQSEVDSLEVRITAVEAEAESLSQFTSFQQLHDARVETIDSLAKSRFDWERVMRELAIVIPKRVWLTNLTGSVAPGVTVNNAAGIAIRASVLGPALEITGCARNQRTVARLIAAMHDIDGVSRVLVPTSSKSAPSVETSTSDPAAVDAGDAAGGDCAIRPSYPTFELVAAFDGIAVASAETGITTDPSTEVPAAVPAEPAATSTTPATTTPAAPATDGGVAAATDDSAEQQGDVAETTQEAAGAADIVGAGG